MRTIVLFLLLLFAWLDTALAQGLVEPRYNKSSSNTWVWDGERLKTRSGQYQFKFNGQEISPVFDSRPLYIWGRSELRPKYTSSFDKTIEWDGRSLERKTNKGQEWVKREDTWKLKYGSKYYSVRGNVPIPIIAFILFRLYER